MAKESVQNSLDNLIKELTDVNERVEKLLKEIPTNDYRKLGELHTLIHRQADLMSTHSGKERGTMFLDRAKRVAIFLRREYFNLKYDGKLRLTDDEE